MRNALAMIGHRVEPPPVEWPGSRNAVFCQRVDRRRHASACHSCVAAPATAARVSAAARSICSMSAWRGVGVVPGHRVNDLAGAAHVLVRACVAEHVEAAQQGHARSCGLRHRSELAASRDVEQHHPAGSGLSPLHPIRRLPGARIWATAPASAASGSRAGASPRCGAAHGAKRRQDRAEIAGFLRHQGLK